MLCRSPPASGVTPQRCSSRHRVAVRATVSERSTSDVHRASKAGKLTVVRDCLSQQNVSVDIPDGNGSSPLMWATSKQRVDVVAELLTRGADPNLTNDYGWSALEYNLERTGVFFSVARSEQIRRLLIDAGAQRRDVTVPPAVLGGDFARLLHSRPFPKDTEGVLADLRYLGKSAGHTLADMRGASDVIEVGGVAIAAVSAKRLGLYAGQRYLVSRLFYRPCGEWEAGERRLDVRTAAEVPAEVREAGAAWQLCAELGNETWMAWGTVEVPVALARLRSVQSELRWALGVAGAAAAFWLLVLPAALTVRFATIPSGSMEPTVHQGDTVVYAPNKAAFERGDIVLLTPPVELTQMALERGIPIRPGDLLVKRLVALSGDVVQVRSGRLSVNGIAELQAYAGASLPCVATCRAADYDYGPLQVPAGQVFLLGDNRGASTDSHVFGPVSESSLIGRAFWRVVGDVGPL